MEVDDLRLRDRHTASEREREGADHKKKYLTQLFSCTDPSLICSARRLTTFAARVRWHDPARSGSTHGLSMLESGTRLPTFERNSISVCGMQPPCTTEQ